MRRNFDWLTGSGNGAQRGVRFWLQAAGAALALLNGVALFMYLAPPGGSRQELMQESLQVRNQIAASRARSGRLKTVANKVQVGSGESGEFEARFFLPKRVAYEDVIAEIQRMATASGLKERDSVFTEEPIEGTADLSLLNATGNYEGTYDNLLRFLHEVDRSPMLLMLDTLQAAPQQHAGQITTSIRFQAVVRDEPAAAAAGGQP
jgi:Tfp pilus assembly protein PilO